MCCTIKDIPRAGITQTIVPQDLIPHGVTMYTVSPQAVRSLAYLKSHVQSRNLVMAHSWLVLLEEPSSECG